MSETNEGSLGSPTVAAAVTGVGSVLPTRRCAAEREWGGIELDSDPRCVRRAPHDGPHRA